MPLVRIPPGGTRKGFRDASKFLPASDFRGQRQRERVGGSESKDALFQSFDISKLGCVKERKNDETRIEGGTDLDLERAKGGHRSRVEWVVKRWRVGRWASGMGWLPIRAFVGRGGGNSKGVGEGRRQGEPRPKRERPVRDSARKAEGPFFNQPSEGEESREVQAPILFEPMRAPEGVEARQSIRFEAAKDAPSSPWAWRRFKERQDSLACRRDNQRGSTIKEQEGTATKTLIKPFRRGQHGTQYPQRLSMLVLQPFEEHAHGLREPLSK
ncbi:hypothetical protein C8R46DRAFT_1038481 [Mycena filopes]|nr:hypothetical protein C8R46DRAFT_1038481 [Mycena filopes]